VNASRATSATSLCPEVSSRRLCSAAISATLDDALAPYLKDKDGVWVLIDNLDKGWPTREPGHPTS